MNNNSLSIREFAEKHGACQEGVEWAMRESTDMVEVWEKAKPDWLIWVATRQGVLDDKTLRLFSCFCARQVWHLMEDERSRRAVEVAELYAEGKATEEELAAAWAAAWDAARAAARDAARAAAWAAWDAWDAAWAAGEATWAAAWAAAEAAWAAARAALAARTAEAAWDAARQTQAVYLRGLNPFRD